jgi:hypothetical protein
MSVCRLDTPLLSGLMSVLHRQSGGLGTKAYRLRALRAPKKARVDVVLVRIQTTKRRRTAEWLHGTDETRA